jgi:hypothetical protein
MKFIGLDLVANSPGAAGQPGSLASYSRLQDVVACLPLG